MPLLGPAATGRGRHAWPLLALTLPLSLAVLDGCRCDRGSISPSPESGTRPDSERTYSRLEPPPREDGPPRAETPADLEASEREARALCQSLRAGGVPGREVASVADIRGYRLYRRRYYGKALAWFEAALSAEPAHELAILNAARVSRLLGRDEVARGHLAALSRLKTALSHSLLQRAATDPDLQGLLRAERARRD